MVGFFQPIYQILGSINIFSASGKLTSLSFGKMKEINKNLKPSYNRIILLQLIIIIILALFHDNIIRVVYGEKFSDYSVFILYLLIGQIFNVINGPTNNILLLNNGESIIGVVSLISLLVNISGNILGLTIGSIPITVGATSLSIIISSLLPMIILKAKRNVIIVSKLNLVISIGYFISCYITNINMIFLLIILFYLFNKFL